MFHERHPERTPPGQHLTRGWPVLHEGPIPTFDEATWRFTVEGLVAAPLHLSCEQFRAMPTTTLTADFHCVTGWSKLDNTWEGVLFKDLAALARPFPGATHVVADAPYGYSANLTLAALLDDDVLFAWSHNGAPLERKHGGPMRLVVPKRYGWKSVKWVNRLRFLADDERGFWEIRGYHNDADPWNEERYAWQES